MSKNNSASSAFERRRKIYEKYGLKPILVVKRGTAIVFSQSPRIIKGDDHNEETSK